jgi:hypothetical protein
MRNATPATSSQQRRLSPSFDLSNDASKQVRIGSELEPDDTPEPEKASALPEAPSAQLEAPLAQPEAPSAQPEASSAAEGEALRVEGERNGVPPNRNWQTPYLQYLHRGELPLDGTEAR